MAQSDVQEIDLFSTIGAEFSIASSLFDGTDLEVLPSLNKPAKKTPNKYAQMEESKAHDAFKTISETADMLDLPAHVLRFWESKFGQLKPLKLRGGRRYYRPQDIDTLVTIKQLLYKQGYTIKGARKALADSRKNKSREAVEMAQEKKSRNRMESLLDTPLFSSLTIPATPEPATLPPAQPMATLSPERKEALRAIHAELLDLKKMLLALPAL